MGNRNKKKNAAVLQVPATDMLRISFHSFFPAFWHG